MNTVEKTVMIERGGNGPPADMRRAVTRQSDSPVSQSPLYCTEDITETAETCKRDLCAGNLALGYYFATVVAQRLRGGARRDEPARKPPTVSPLAVTDPKIRVMLQLAGLRFMCSRARWLDHEAMLLGKALKSGAMTSDEVDAKLEEMGALDLCYPELMGGGE